MLGRIGVASLPLTAPDRFSAGPHADAAPEPIFSTGRRRGLGGSQRPGDNSCPRLSSGFCGSGQATKKAAWATFLLLIRVRPLATIAQVGHHPLALLQIITAELLTAAIEGVGAFLELNPNWATHDLQ
ncbi:hypothetical protein SAMN04488540_102213 [Ferrimonas sediminum]|uniref:Uncharacterized protein n=1 Tax=Ferrimonas sediminum TaxID=718193 RepID=A0A1G8LYV4_9GAMM|nr:hypothetical protein SAMN04488540_102213 [Ferrimonas sediminum]